MTERQPSWPATPPPAGAPGPPGDPAMQASAGHPAPPDHLTGASSLGPWSAAGAPFGPSSGAAAPFRPSSAAASPLGSYPAAGASFGQWPAGPPPAGPPPYGLGGHGRPPSGLFPGHSRPIYREPHPILAAPVLSGFGATLLWLALFGGLAHDLASYAWWTIVASITAWAMAIVLTVLGDRGVAVGIALASGLGLSIAVAFVGARWITTYDWPLW